MREFITRSLSGIVYAGVIIGATAFHPYALLALLAVILTAGIVELKHLTVGERAKTLFLTLNLLGILLLWVHLQFLQDYQNHLVAFLVIVIMSVLIHWVFIKRTTINTEELVYVILGIVYILLPLALAFNIAFIKGHWQPQTLLAIFFFLWANDSFAYITGKWLGKHKLFPQLSPKKTIEGFVGGLIGALVIAHVIAYFWSNLTVTEWVILSVLTAVFGTIGDLFESALKRAADVKDSGNLIPGHGGILDRLDSFLFAIPIAYFYLYFFA